MNSVEALTDLLLRMTNKEFRNVNDFHCSQLIQAFYKARHFQRIIDILNYMENDKIIANPITCLSFAKLFSNPEALLIARRFYSYVSQTGIEQTARIKAALLTMFAKSGDLNSASQIFNGMKSQEMDTVTWNAMISALVQNGDSKEAIKLFNRMQEHHFKPDNFTFSLIFSACADLGDLQLGQKIHKQMATSSSPLSTPTLNSLLTMYAKCGNLPEAASLFEEMRSRNQANVVTWNAIIAGYIKQNHPREALDLFKQMELHGPRPN